MAAGNIIRTHSGLELDIMNPLVTQIFPIDIAVGLARECRFQGGARNFYSVAEHSVWCALRAEEDYPFEQHLPFKLLLHDAHEYILKDIPTPLKSLLTNYKELANRLQSAIHTRFGVTITTRDKVAIEQIDAAALEWEWSNKVTSWAGMPPLPERAAVDYFLHHFQRLCKTPFVVYP